jgi:hypothetical protein
VHRQFSDAWLDDQPLGPLPVAVPEPIDGDIRRLGALLREAQRPLVRSFFLNFIILFGTKNTKK